MHFLAIRGKYKIYFYSLKVVVSRLYRYIAVGCTDTMLHFVHANKLLQVWHS